jgi:hypothetical protein
MSSSPARRLGQALALGLALATLALVALRSGGGAGDGPVAGAGAGDGPRAGGGAGAGGAAAPPVAVEIASPAPAGSAEPNLVAGPDGVWLSWLERRGGDRHALRFARWDGAGWSEPGQVMERGGLFVNWADFPSMAVLSDGTLAAHWLERNGPRSYDYDVRVALSRDGGATWSDDIVPHRDGVQAEHGFVSMLPVDGGLGVVWLDGRETLHDRPMTLRFTTLSGDGGLGDDVLLDGSVCDCCQTAAVRTPDGLVVAYRGRTEGEVRDIRVVRRTGDGWSAPRKVHEDGWVINACPVNGPALAADGDLVAVAWLTGAPPEPRVLAAFSRDGGASFGPPVRVDDGQGMGRVAVTMLDGGEALVTWLERAGAGAEIRTRRVRGDGGAGPSAPLAATAAARASGFPRVARLGDTLLFAWTEPGETPVVRTAVAGLGAADGRGVR